MTSRILKALAASAVLPLVATAQLPTIDLTGPPAARLSTPLSAVSHGVELQSGAFVFVDRVEVEVKRADLSRDAIATLGRVGGGPLEYRRPDRAVADGQGGALIPESSDFRMLRVLPTGALARSDLPLVDAKIRPLWIRGVDPQGRLIHWGPINSATRGQVPIHRWDPATRQFTLLGQWPTRRVRVGAPQRTPQGTTREIMDATLWPLRAAWVALGDGTVAIVHPEPYHVEIVRPDGRKLLGPTVDYRPVRVTAALREAVRAERGPMPDNVFPEELPPFEGLEDVIGSPRGEVWVRRMQDPSDPFTLYDVFNASGVRIAQARLSKHAQVVGFGAGSVYVAREDVEEGLWYLERYELRAAP
jgi:hypothetical protein